MDGLERLERLWREVGGVGGVGEGDLDVGVLRTALMEVLGDCGDVMGFDGGDSDGERVEWMKAVTLFPEVMRKNPSLGPIVDTIERLIQEEISRREKAIEEIRALQMDLEGIISELSESQGVVEDLGGLTLFEMLGKLRRQFEASRNMLNERKQILEDVMKKTRNIKEELMDLMPFEFEVHATGYSRKSIYLHEENLRHLINERDRRWNSLSTLHTDLILIYTQIGFPTTSPKDRTLKAFLTQTHPPQEKDILSCPYPTLRERFVRAINESKEGEWYLRLSRSTIAELEERRDFGRNRLGEMVAECRVVVKEVGMFWDQLGVPLEERFELKVDVRRLDEFKAVADKLRIGWKRLMGGELIETMEKMQAMWRKCHISREEQEQTKKGFPPNFFSPLTVEFLRNEIALVGERYEREKHLILLIEQRNAYIEKLKEFEIDASDPNRLFKASFRLLEEEKFRKASVPILMKMENQLRNAVRDFEAENYPFFFEGRRWIHTLDQELQDRFINKALFLFDTSHLRQSRVPIPPPSPTRQSSRSSASNASSNSFGARSPSSLSVRSNSPTPPLFRPDSPLSEPHSRRRDPLSPDSSPRRYFEKARDPSPLPRRRSESGEWRLGGTDMTRQTSRTLLHYSPPPSPQPYTLSPVPAPSSRVRTVPPTAKSTQQRPSSYHAAVSTASVTTDPVGSREKMSRRLTMPNLQNLPSSSSAGPLRRQPPAGVPMTVRSSSIPVAVGNAQKRPRFTTGGAGTSRK
ncbi:carboxypeptidase C prc1 [Dinochytrium kinnereticum]|nr:carboxypeptidase C prc1 [Dinochytrium kinnereticum]